MKQFVVPSLTLAVFLGQAEPAKAVTLNFDSVATGSDCVDATSYLAGFGVTFTPVTVGC